MVEETLKLENNLTVYFEPGLDGGGSTQRQDFVDAVSKTGKSHFNRIFEWCAGPGFIGYTFLDKKMCNHVVFSDIHNRAIHFVNITAEKNNIVDSVTTYVCDEINKIPLTEKWDLVLSNPPHCFDQHTLNQMKNNPDMTNIMRILCDVNYVIHKEFFENIIKYLEPGADLFLSETYEDPIIKNLAITNGLTFIDFHPAPMLAMTSASVAGVFQFKYIP